MCPPILQPPYTNGFFCGQENEQNYEPTIPKNLSMKWHSLTSHFTFVYHTCVPLPFPPPPSSKRFNVFAYFMGTWMNGITKQQSLTISVKFKCGMTLSHFSMTFTYHIMFPTTLPQPSIKSFNGFAHEIKNQRSQIISVRLKCGITLSNFSLYFYLSYVSPYPSPTLKQGFNGLAFFT